MNSDRILIVDDEPDIALILKLQLEDAGYRTERARDGMDALDQLSRGEYSLMLLDIKMPRMDGMAVLARVNQEYPDLAVMMMTAHGSEDIAVQALQKGAIDYIAKPFSTDDMLKRVERAIQFNRTRLENLRLQKQLDVERQKMEVVLQGMADLLVAIDTNGRIMTVNRRAEDILGKSRDELLGMPVEEVITADIGADLLPCRLVLASRVPCLDITYQLILGTTRIPVLSSATPLVNGAGELVGSVEILRDISTLKALEQEREDFVSMLSHDLKTPITAIVGSLDLVREGRLGPINEEQREYLESALESSTEMTEMIDTLLDVHKFEAGKMVLVFREEDPRLLVQKILARFRSVAHRTQIDLHATCREPLPVFRVDRHKFSRLVNNLLSNAFKFTPDGGEIEVGMEELVDIAACRDRIPAQTYPPSALPVSGRFLQVTVRDTGEGMPAEALGTIFDRFVQAKNRRLGKTRGTGLGLAFCRKVMDAHGGFIWAESREGHGSTFFLLFPLEEGKTNVEL
ncbi:response regulator [Geobacter sp. AOG1]|uniref:ATP-binding response regulator n=1 Tax=Geobacter sp. AOG1 TaxID=1566346 RepID=UPI001CC336F3|nr:response regulator [Geobacter sp. AOG1]GFE56971.1 hybrid sensor histidine kinase/response regulator [Geobacter sp. AOG1]